MLADKVGGVQWRAGRDPERVPRVRSPQPLISTRVRSGRGATEQPNASGDDTAPLTPIFWLLVVLVGVATGLMGAALMWVLRSFQHLFYGYHGGSFGVAADHAWPVRRLIVLVVAGAICGPAWYVLRRVTAGESSDLDDELWTGTGKLSFRRSLGTSVLSEFAVGAGASLGREAAPKLMGGAVASVLATWRDLTPQQRRLLVACGGGAGMGAVYNVPLGGALIAAELLYGSLALPVILPALACSWIATAVSWIYLPTTATYVSIPSYPLRATLVVFTFVAGPLIGLVAVGYIRLIGWVSYYRAAGRWLLVAPLGAFTILGVLALRYPLLLGNGRYPAQLAFLGIGGSALTLLVLIALKPLVTAMCVGSGVTGGLFTPTLATGAMLGLLLGRAWTHLWPGSPLGAYAVIAAAAMIGSSMQAPLAALALMVELTRTTDDLIVAMIAATVLAAVVVRYLDGYSIYSSRLPKRSDSRRGERAATPAGERL
ncbi:MAG TPA: chloride channel protein [Mycobacteriales bacterium]|nr:chloride channel protein [Mycobacteriales bacterium]